MLIYALVSAGALRRSPVEVMSVLSFPVLLSISIIGASQACNLPIYFYAVLPDDQCYPQMATPSNIITLQTMSGLGDFRFFGRVKFSRSISSTARTAAEPATETNHFALVCAMNATGTLS